MLYLRLIRVKQWVKNFFIFIPAFFAGNIFEPDNVLRLVAGFIAFSFIASAIYIINDYLDIEADRKHPVKKNRPLASGAVSKRNAIVSMVILAIGGLGLSFYLSAVFFGIVILYFFLNIGYSLGLKNISILDIFIVASGFLFRTLAGGILVGVPVSHWLIIMVFLLALFLALAKRRDDVLMFISSGKIMRKSSQEYNLDFANSALTFLSAVIVVAYIMYTVSDDVTLRLHTEWVIYTSIFVLAGILRYLQIIFVQKDSGNPTEVLYKDKFILVTILGWILAYFTILYLPGYLNV